MNSLLSWLFHYTPLYRLPNGNSFGASESRYVHTILGNELCIAKSLQNKSSINYFPTNSHPIVHYAAALKPQQKPANTSSSSHVPKRSKSGQQLSSTTSIPHSLTFHSFTLPTSSNSKPTLLAPPPFLSNNSRSTKHLRALYRPFGKPTTAPFLMMSLLSP
ncbi:hypothetical protein MAM1_0003d00274 [Mucor ambiguus]|uniref:Uncharacterized protein n=1 Tax=Mucor ambiguus TaxID=91626 RepID=A0A0C9LPJ3_9FUNG|nr:hypothetical protein MAM1_0003d00274 [Mucor ambiguus]